MTIYDLIKRAEDEWEMERLKRDLAYYKALSFSTNRVKTELSEKEEYRCLCGLLCNVDPKTITKLLDRNPNSLRPALSRGLYRYIQELVETKNNQTIEKFQWFRIPEYLWDYKRKIIEWEISINLDDIEVNLRKVDLSKVKEILGDSIRIKKDKNGKITLMFKTTYDIFIRAKGLFDSGELSELLGIPILDIQPITTNVTRTAEEQKAFTNSLLKRCRREGYDWVELSQFLEILNAVQQAYLTTEEAILAALRELLYPDTQTVSVSKSGDDEDSDDNSAEEDLDTEFLNALTEEIVKFCNPE